MTEEFAILFAANLMCARKLVDVDEKPSPVRMSTVDKASGTRPRSQRPIATSGRQDPSHR